LPWRWYSIRLAFTDIGLAYAVVDWLAWVAGIGLVGAFVELCSGPPTRDTLVPVATVNLVSAVVFAAWLPLRGNEMTAFGVPTVVVATLGLVVLGAWELWLARAVATVEYPFSAYPRNTARKQRRDREGAPGQR
jgi:hypothetical protein